MTRITILWLCATLLWLASVAASAHAQAPDVDVRSWTTQTALWVGSPVGYHVTLTCRPGVDVLQEDLGADRLVLTGLQVASHSVTRDTLGDGRVEYRLIYTLTTFEPSVEAVSIADWRVRFAAERAASGGSTPAQEVLVPGATLAWRSVLPAALNTLRPRDARAVTPAPWWWSRAQEAGVLLMGLGVAALGWVVVARVTAGRVRPVKRRPIRQSARDLEATLSALDGGSVDAVEERRAAFTTLEGAIRRRVQELSDQPAMALTPSELAPRLAAAGSTLPGAEIGRLLAKCEAARFQPAARMPSAEEFRSVVHAARDLLGRAR